MISILFGLLSAFAWGASDFAGGLASRRTPVFKVVILTWGFGLAMITIIAVVLREPFLDWKSFAFCFAAGITGVIGILALYQSLASSQMSISASVSAVMAAALPVITGAIVDGLPDISTLSGIFLAIIGVWLISRQQHSDNDTLNKEQRKALTLAFLSGGCFGLYFILMNMGSSEGLFIPMLISHGSGVCLLIIIMILQKRSCIPTKADLPLIIVNFLLDLAGTIFYIRAGQAGRMDVAAVLASLYPGVTILLAGIWLRERINKLQWLGIGLAMLAVVFLST